MRLIKRSTLRLYAVRFPKAEPAIDRWFKLVRASAWENLDQTRKTFPHADQVRVESGKLVTIFNLAGNSFRLITAIHYDRKKVFILRFFTHAEYSRDEWKKLL